MPSPVPVNRVRGDACPGVLRLTPAADGGLARIRLVGGFLDEGGLAALTAAAVDLGDGRLELTSRGNVQVRGLDADAGAELGVRMHAAGLWPSPGREQLRNIVASPLAGLDRDTDLRALVDCLDVALCTGPARLAALSGRFLFAVDDGRGDVGGLGADVLIRADGVVDGLVVGDPVAAAVAVADAFLDERAAQSSSAWRIADLADGASRVRSRAAVALGVDSTMVEPGHLSGPPSAGPFTRHDGRRGLVLAVPLGRLDLAQLRWLGSVIGAETARVTPWRSIVLPEADSAVVREAAALGFGVTADTPWADVSACAGRPGCGKALADVQHDARAQPDRRPGRVVHWSGCERRCGRPARTEIDVVATGIGYRIEDHG